LKVSNKTGNTLDDVAYMEMMCQALNKVPKRQGTTNQAPSTMRNLSRDPKEDEKWFNRPMPEDWKCEVTHRPIAPDEYSAHKATQSSRNTLGESKKSATTITGRDRAIQGFIYSPPAKVTKKEVDERAVNLTAFKTSPLTEVWVEIPWYKALFHWIKGNSIKQSFEADKIRQDLE